MGLIIWFSILALLYGAASVHSDCQITAEGYTWTYLGDRDERMLDVSAQDCRSACLQIPGCLGYTWFPTDVVDTCYLFHGLENNHACDGCLTGSVPTEFQEACREDGLFFIALLLKYIFYFTTKNSSKNVYFNLRA